MQKSEQFLKSSSHSIISLMERPSIALVDHGKQEIIRKSAEYHPSVWGDYFIHNSSLALHEEVQVLYYDPFMIFLFVLAS